MLGGSAVPDPELEGHAYVYQGLEVCSHVRHSNGVWIHRRNLVTRYHRTNLRYSTYTYNILWNVILWT